MMIGSATLSLALLDDAAALRATLAGACAGTTGDIGSATLLLALLDDATAVRATLAGAGAGTAGDFAGGGGGGGGAGAVSCCTNIASCASLMNLLRNGVCGD